MRYLVAVLISTSLAIGAVAQNPPTLPPAPDVPKGEIVENLSCAVDPTQTYALYLPSSYDPSNKQPMLLVFDPRGRATTAAEIFRQAAERYGWIIVSSYDTRSDTATMEPNIRAINALWPEIHRYAIDPKRVYATGFSGGSILAWMMAQGTGGLAGMIGCGGRLSTDDPIGRPAFAHFGAAGSTDFNYLEMKEIDALLEKAGSRHRFEVFDGRHQWLPVALANDAIGWLELEAMKGGLRTRDDVIVEELWSRDLAAARALEAEKRPLDAMRRYQAIGRTFVTLHSVDDVNARATSLASDRTVKGAIRDEEKWDLYETNYLRSKAGVVLGAFRREADPVSLGWFLGELRIAELRAWAAKGDYRGVMAQRILSSLYAQTSFYLPRQFVEAGNYSRAAFILSAAVEIAPTVPGGWYDLACARAQAGDRKKSIVALAKAVELGFHDRAHIENDTDLLSIREEAGYRKIVDGLTP